MNESSGHGKAARSKQSRGPLVQGALRCCRCSQVQLMCTTVHSADAPLDALPSRRPGQPPHSSVAGRAMQAAAASRRRSPLARRRRAQRRAARGAAAGRREGAMCCWLVLHAAVQAGWWAAGTGVEVGVGASGRSCVCTSPRACRAGRVGRAEREARCGGAGRGGDSWWVPNVGRVPTRSLSRSLPLLHSTINTSSLSKLTSSAVISRSRVGRGGAAMAALLSGAGSEAGAAGAAG